MSNQEPCELQIAMDQHSYRQSMINWFLLDAGIRQNEDYRKRANVLVLLDLISPLIAKERKRFNNQREGWLAFVANETKALRYYLNLFKDNRFVGEMLVGVGSETQAPAIGPMEFVRLVGWGRAVNDAKEFYRNVLWLLHDATVIEIERKYELGTDVAFQFALGFVRGMKLGKPTWVDDFPIQGPRPIDEYFIRHLEEVEKAEPASDKEKYTLGRASYNTDAAFYFYPNINESCDLFYRHHDNDRKTTLVVQNADGLGCSSLHVELEFTKLNGCREVRLFAGKHPASFGLSIEMTQFKLNPELLGLLLRIALASRLQVELLTEPSAVPFTELTGNVLIADERFTASGFPKLF